MARTIFKLPLLSHVETRFNEIGMLNIYQINHYLTCLFMFKYERNVLPTVFNNFFITHSNIHSYNTRFSSGYSSEPAKTNLKLFSINCRGPFIYSRIPSINKTAISLFKKELNLFLLANPEFSAFLYSSHRLQ